MRPLKSHAPYCLYKKQIKAGYFWYVRFWNEASRKYDRIRSTGIPVKGRGGGRHDAEEAARAMLPRISLNPDAPEKSFVQYISDFWTPEGPYIRECATVKKQPLSAAYVNLHHEDVGRHIGPFSGFQGVTLQSLTPGIIRDWMTWAADRGLAGGRINKVMQAMSVAVRYAVSRGELDKDPFKNIKEAADHRKEKGILSAAEVSLIIRTPGQDPRGRLAVLFGLLCGMRLGEVRGLQWGDIGDGLISVCHNYQDLEGVKAPKCGSSRIAPFPDSVKTTLDEVRKTALNPGPNNLVMESPGCPGKPYSKTHFSKHLSLILTAIGIPGEWQGEEQPPKGYVNEQKRRNLTFHSLRHTFITLGRLAGIADMEIQALAGHKSGAMMERYSHAGQVLDFAAAREKLEKAIGGNDV